MPKDATFSWGYIEVRYKEENHKHSPHCHVHFRDGASLWVQLGAEEPVVRFNE